MSLYFRSFYFHLANQELAWLPMDTEERYQENLKNHRDQLERYGWIDANISYKFNQHGFRCDKFSDNPSIVFLGCSHTLGIGLPVESTWAYQVARELDLKCVNLGIGGGCNDTAYRLAYYWLNKLKPKIVVLLSPSPDRFEIVIDDLITIFYPTGNHSTKEYGNFYRDWTADSNTGLLNQQKNIAGIRELANNINADFFVFDLKELTMGQGLARDLAHSGSEANASFAKLVLSDICRTA
jgi:hypothetical protein